MKILCVGYTFSLENMLDFIDETGTENMISVDPDFPLLGLGTLIISKSEYRKLDLIREIL